MNVSNTGGVGSGVWHWGVEEDAGSAGFVGFAGFAGFTKRLRPHSEQVWSRWNIQTCWFSLISTALV